MPAAPKSHPHEPAKQAQQGGFAKHHGNNPLTFPSHGQQDADFMSAFEHGHEHRVHDAKTSDDDGQERGAPAHGPRDAESLAGGHHFTGHHGAAFGENFLNLLAKLAHVLLRELLGVTRTSMKLILPSFAVTS